METTWIFRPSKLHREKYVEATWIFRPAKLHRKKYVEATWIFRPAKLHRKSKRKWRGNSSKFGLRRIDVISTSNRCGFDVVCPLGSNFDPIINAISSLTSPSKKRPSKPDLQSNLSHSFKQLLLFNISGDTNVTQTNHVLNSSSKRTSEAYSGLHCQTSNMELFTKKLFTKSR